MLLALIVSHLFILVVGNPFHKYPYAFLLDVGNEELEKASTQQFRLSIPGGSLALRYPAIGDGNTIGHIRVSGIDFGTDLKANIVDGGPGYKYVVLVFMGNPGVAYDAVVTVQTVNDNSPNTYSENVPYIGRAPQLDYGGDTDQIENDANNSAEDFSDDDQGGSAQSVSSIELTNAELMQSSSNVYKYAQSDVGETNDVDEGDGASVSKNDDEDDDYDLEKLATGESGNANVVDDESDADDQKDIHEQYEEDIEQEDVPNIQTNSIDDDDDFNEDISPQLGQAYQNDDLSNPQPISIVDKNLYSKYEALKPHLNFDGIVYSEEELQNSGKPVYQEDPLDYEDPDSIGQSNYDDDIDKYEDSNNNNYGDANDGYAVEY